MLNIKWRYTARCIWWFQGYLEQSQSLVLGWLIIRNRTTGARRPSHLYLFQLVQYVSPLNILFFITYFLSFRAVFWVASVSHPRKDQNSRKPQLCALFCECPVTFFSQFSCLVRYLLFTNPVWVALSLYSWALLLTWDTCLGGTKSRNFLKYARSCLRGICHPTKKILMWG